MGTHLWREGEKDRKKGGIKGKRRQEQNKRRDREKEGRKKKGWKGERKGRRKVEKGGEREGGSQSSEPHAICWEKFSCPKAVELTISQAHPGHPTHISIPGSLTRVLLT